MSLVSHRHELLSDERRRVAAMAIAQIVHNSAAKVTAVRQRWESPIAGRFWRVGLGNGMRGRYGLSY